MSPKCTNSVDVSAEIFVAGTMDLYEVLILMLPGCSLLITLSLYIGKDNRRKQISLPCCLVIEGGLRSFTKAERF